MPFITEEIWSHLSQYKSGNFSESIAIAQWPISKIDKTENKVVEEATWKYEVIQVSRNIRAGRNISFHEKLNLVVVPSSQEEEVIFTKEKDSIMSVINAEDIQIKKEISAKEKFSSQVTSSGTCVYILLKDIDLERENIRIKKELSKMDEGLIRIEKKLANRDFMSKAQPSAIEKCKAEKEESLKKREKLYQILKTIGGK